MTQRHLVFRPLLPERLVVVTMGQKSGAGRGTGMRRRVETANGDAAKTPRVLRRSASPGVPSVSAAVLLSSPVTRASRLR